MQLIWFVSVLELCQYLAVKALLGLDNKQKKHVGYGVTPVV